ncbi:MAG: hypothetical protein ACXV5H_11120 [Halobacteriota archaeon]
MAQEQDPEGEKKQIKQVLHEPISPYVTDSFNTATHLIQGVNLAALFYVISIQTKFDLLVAGKILVLFLMIGLIWYSYLTQNQFVGWRPRKRDTIIPISFALTQCLLAVSIHQPIYVFAFFFTLILVVGFLGFANPYSGNAKPDAALLFKEHFKAQGAKFAEDFRLEIINIDKRLMTSMISFVAFFGIITALLYLFQSVDEVASYAFVALCGVFIVTLFHFDFMYFLNHSETMKKYGYKF